ncbi:MAG: hypothetical protein WBD20_00435 [Pirellulaceae bacterium]
MSEIESAPIAGASLSGSEANQNAEVGYHPLALDPEDPGVWGWIDRTCESLSAWINPILIKEARQSLKSRQFLVTFFLLLIASCLWTVLGVVSYSPDVYYVPKGNSFLIGYYLVMAIPMMGMVPLAAHRSLVAEIEDDTFEMLVITRLSSMRIVMGKLNSAVLQMLIYFAAIVPCLAFSYLLRGVSLPMIAAMIVATFFTALLVTCFALMLSTLAFNRAGQTIALLVVLAVILFAEIMCFAFIVDGLLQSADDDIYLGVAAYVIVGISCMVLFIKAAAARIAPISENRSTGLRLTMFAQQLVWISVMAIAAMWYSDYEPINFGSMVLAGYWLVMGAVMMAESAELSPRVQRSLPSTAAGRSFLTWFNPGPATGYVFAVTTGCVGIGALGVFGAANASTSPPSTPPPIFSCLVAGYLMVYLGITRMIVLPIMRRTGSTIVVTLSTLAAVMFIALVLPLVIIVATTGGPPKTYMSIEIIDWAWSMDEAFSTGGIDEGLAILMFSIGSLITMINLGFLLRVFQYRRISVPQRVAQDKAT